MSRPSRSERLANKARPKRRAAGSHLFKYQLANNPSRAEENDLKLALQESLKEQDKSGRKVKKTTTTNNKNVIISSTNSSDISKSNNSTRYSSNQSAGSLTSGSNSSGSGSGSGSSAPTPLLKRTRSSYSTPPPTQTSNVTPISPPNNKRAKLNTSTDSNGIHKSAAPTTKLINAQQPNQQFATTLLIPQLSNKAIKTYSRSQPNNVIIQQEEEQQQQQQQQQKPKQQIGLLIIRGPKSSTPIKNLVSNSLLAAKQQGSASATNTVPKTSTLSKDQSLSYTSKSTQTFNISAIKQTATPGSDKTDQRQTTASNNQAVGNKVAISTTGSTVSGSIEKISQPVQEQHLKFKRESKNYAYAKMTALKVNTSKSPSNSKSPSSKKLASPTIGILCGDSVNKELLSSRNNSTKTDSGTNAVNNGNSSQLERQARGLKLDGNKSADHLTVNNRNSDATGGGGKKSNISPKASALNDKNSSVKSNKTMNKSASVSSPSSKNSSIQKQKDSTQLTCHNKEKTDCSTLVVVPANLSQNKNQNTNVKLTKKRSPQGSWSLLGVPEEKVIYLRDDEPPKRLICYPAIKHVEGDVIQVRDSVLLRSGARKTDLPYIAKVCAFWEDAETGNVMMSLFWYYRPEHTEEGRKPHHLIDEIFASKHRDADSVECIEDKCYVLTFNEYCRYRKRCKMEQVNATWCLTDVTIPVFNEQYPRRNRIPDSNINPELVFCCRQIYDSRLKRLIKNPMINSKYGHI